MGQRARDLARLRLGSWEGGAWWADLFGNFCANGRVEAARLEWQV